MKVSTLTLQELFGDPTMQALEAFAKAREIRLYLVGGSVRDLLLSRQIADFDFAVASDAIHFAKAFAADIRATCITLEEEPPTARVIVKKSDNSQLTLDVTQFRAGSLTDDLRLRDLTINAMAIAFENPASVTNQTRRSDVHPVIDPCNGMRDLAARQLRFPSERVILADPIRLLRIYRFAAQLEFEIPQESGTFVQRHQKLLPNVAPERCRAELMKILDIEKAHPYLQEMDAVGLLAQVLPVVHQVAIPWRRLKKFEALPIPIPLTAYAEKIDTYLQEELGDGVSRRAIIKLSLLLDGNIEKRLRLSRRATQLMKGILSKYPQFLKGISPQLTRKQIICFLREAASDWWGVLLYAAAAQPIHSEVLKRIADTYYTHVLPIQEQGRLITGNDLMQTFNLKAGKQIGYLLAQVEERQFNGEIRTRKEAFAAVAALIHQSE